MITRVFDREFLVKDLDLPYAAKEEKIIDSSRWSVTSEIIFEYEGKHYMTEYSKGATECQDESPWEDEDEVECIEVEYRDVVIKKWMPIKN